MTNNEKKRLHYIDFMKGVCIILIITNHVDQRIFALAGSNMNYAIESFRIPMYYFISGLFFKTYAGIGDFTRRKVNNIIVPLCFFYLLSCAIIGLAQFIAPLQRTFGTFEWSMLSDPLTQRLWRANVPMWFLVSLFEVNIIFYALHNLLNRKLYVGLGCIILSLLGYYLSTHKIEAPLLLDTALLGLPYFAMGSFLKQSGFLTTHHRSPWQWICLPLTLAIIYPFAQEINLWMQVLPNYFYLYLVPAVSIMSLTWACKGMRYVPIINFIGRYSLVVLCTHFLVMPFVERLLSKLFHHQQGMAIPIAVVIVIIILELFIIKFFIKRFPHFTAQKQLFMDGWRLSLREHS